MKNEKVRWSILASISKGIKSVPPWLWAIIAAIFFAAVAVNDNYIMDNQIKHEDMITAVSVYLVLGSVLIAIGFAINKYLIVERISRLLKKRFPELFSEKQDKIKEPTKKKQREPRKKFSTILLFTAVMTIITGATLSSLKEESKFAILGFFLVIFGVGISQAVDDTFKKKFSNFQESMNEKNNNKCDIYTFLLMRSVYLLIAVNVGAFSVALARGNAGELIQLLGKTWMTVLPFIIMTVVFNFLAQVPFQESLSGESVAKMTRFRSLQFVAAIFFAGLIYLRAPDVVKDFPLDPYTWIYRIIGIVLVFFGIWLAAKVDHRIESSDKSLDTPNHHQNIKENRKFRIQLRGKTWTITIPSTHILAMASGFSAGINIAFLLMAFLCMDASLAVALGSTAIFYLLIYEKYGTAITRTVRGFYLFLRRQTE